MLYLSFRFLFLGAEVKFEFYIISFARQYFFRLSSFFTHKLFTNFQYDRVIKRTTNYFFDRFFSYFPLLEPLNKRFFFCQTPSGESPNSFQTQKEISSTKQEFSEFCLCPNRQRQLPERDTNKLSPCSHPAQR